MNGKYRIRSTPDNLKWLETDSYQITLRKDYFLDTSFIADAVEGEKTSLFINIAANPKMLGDLFISSVPDSAEIYLNDSLLDKVTPILLKRRLPGKYKITLRKKNTKTKSQVS